MYIYQDLHIFGMFLGSGEVFTSQGHKSCVLEPHMPLLMEYDNLETKSLAMRCDLRYLVLGESGCKSGFRDLRADTELSPYLPPLFKRCVAFPTHSICA